MQDDADAVMRGAAALAAFDDGGLAKSVRGKPFEVRAASAGVVAHFPARIAGAANARAQRNSRRWRRRWRRDRPRPVPTAQLSLSDKEKATA